MMLETIQAFLLALGIALVIGLIGLAIGSIIGQGSDWYIEGNIEDPATYLMVA